MLTPTERAYFASFHGTIDARIASGTFGDNEWHATALVKDIAYFNRRYPESLTIRPAGLAIYRD